MDVYDEDMLKYDFYKADLPALTAALSAINWVSALGNPQADVDAAVNRFYVILRDLIHKHVPVKTPRRRYNCPWMNPRLASCRNRRNRAHRSY